MKRLLFAFLLMCLFCTCKKDPYANLCGGSDPIKNLSWLKAKINDLNKNNLNATLTRGEYNGQTLYFFNVYCCDTCSCFGPVPYDCDGNFVKLSLNQYEDVTYNNKLMYKQILWQR